MNSTIKARIEKIENGEVPEGYKKTKIGIVPKEWKEYALGEIFSNRNETNCDGLELLSITADRGVIPRSQIEEKDNSSEDKSKYKHICIGDIGYNTMRMWQGVSALSKYDGIVSPAYTVLKSKNNVDAKYASFYFKFTPVVNLFYRNSQGLVDDTRNLKYEWFRIIKVVFPKMTEQMEIAEILSTQDRVIELKEKLLAEKQQQKKYLMQQLLTPKRRFPGFAEEWKKMELGNIFDYIQPTNYIVQSLLYNDRYLTPVLTAGKSFILGYTNETDGIFNDVPVVIFDDFTTSSKYVDFPFKVKSSAIKILKCKKDYNIIFAFHMLQSVRYVVGGHERHWISKFVNIPVKFPSLEEQTAIAEVLSTADKEIELLKKDIEQEKLKKKSLMQLLLTGIIRVDEFVS